MSHRESAGGRPPWWRRWPRRRQQVHLPDYLWPLVVRMAQTQRLTPEQWVRQAVAGAASAQVLGQQPPRDGERVHPRHWREALKALRSAPEVHWRLVRQGTVSDLDGRFTAGDPQEHRWEAAVARPRSSGPRTAGRPAGQ